MNADVRTNDPRSRWLLLAAAMLVQFALGSVYAWSVFNQPLQTAFGWSKPQTVLAFEVAIGCIFIGAFLGGRVQDRTGPRRVAIFGSALYAIGLCLCSQVDRADELWLLIFGFGVLGGIGLGAAYITPVAMLGKWFPDKRGLIVGLAVGGFGFGSLIVAPLARALIDPQRPTLVLLWLGISLGTLALIGSSFFRNPPAVTKKSDTTSYTLRQALRTRAWYLLTLTLFLNVTCGIALVSQASDAAQNLAGVGATTAAALVGLLGLFNGAGRIVFAAISDRIGRTRTLAIMLALQGVCFILISQSINPIMFVTLAALIYLCYGGGFGVMPATAADFFGTANAGAIYGAMIIAWSAGGVVGPVLTSVGFQHFDSYQTPFKLIGVVAVLAVFVPLFTAKPRSVQ